MRSDARRNEASALANARREAVEETNAKWQDIVAEKDAKIAETAVKWQGVIVEKDAALAEKDAALAEKDAEIARLRAMLGENK
jgi:hypothetical protein